MLTAHLPSGYCLGKLSGLKAGTFGAALIGSVFPDIDMLFFLFVDEGAIHHHKYWVHIPVFWAGIAVLTGPILWKSNLKAPFLAFMAAIYLHLLLDSISGGIMWGAPINSELWELVTVPASRPHWVLSFLLHWTFLLEIGVWALAACLLYRDRKLVSPNRSDSRQSN